MGGCGTIELSNDWPLRQSHRLHSNGAALGLRFRKLSFNPPKRFFKPQRNSLIIKPVYIQENVEVPCVNVWK